MGRLIVHCCLQFLLLLGILSRVVESSIRIVYYYSHRTYTSGTTYYYSPVISIGAIIGSVIGALSFIGFAIGVCVCVCCIHRRRGLQAQQASIPMTANGAPSTSTVPDFSGAAYPKQDGISYVVSQPPPPYQEGMAPGNGYLGQMQQPPYPAYAQPGQQPYPMLPPPVYSQPAAANEEQRF